MKGHDYLMKNHHRFDRSLATLFCMAGGLVGWTEVLPDLADSGSVNADFYFLASFIVIVSWTLLQVQTIFMSKSMSPANFMHYIIAT
jgi:hypothetical protein